MRRETADIEAAYSGGVRDARLAGVEERARARAHVSLEGGSRGREGLPDRF